MNSEKTNFSYDELSKLLDIQASEVEMWAIEAITNKIIDAKIDQLNSEIVIKSHKLKEIKKQEWLSIQGKIRLWREKFERMHEVLGASNEMAQK